MAEWLLVVLTFIIAVFTYLVWKVYEKIAWFTGAMESHSELMLRIEALRGIGQDQPIELIWWDPTIQDPPIDREHGKPVEMKRIYVYLPLKYRRDRPSLKARLWQLFRLPDA